MYRPVTASSRTRRRKGGAAGEMAIILPLLVTLLLAAADFGRFASLYIALANAARAGAQYGAMNNYSSSTLGTETTSGTWKYNVAQAAKNEIANQYASSGLTVTVATPTADGNGVRHAKVTAKYTFTTLINWNWTGLNLPHSMDLTQQAELPIVR